jgi:hypothetical protein
MPLPILSLGRYRPHGSLAETDLPKMVWVPEALIVRVAVSPDAQVPLPVIVTMPFPLARVTRC